MKPNIFFYFLLGCGIVLLIGMLTMFNRFNDSEYYREQTYNNLQSLNKPEAIQHYEQKIDEFNQQTVAEIPKNEIPLNETTILRDAFHMRKSDGSYNRNFFLTLGFGYLGLVYFFQEGFCK